MINNEFCVLHLSDLHIKNIADYYSPALKTLISDIAFQVKPYKDIILVVSGDIIDRGDYNNNKETALNFFTDLKQEIGDKVIDVQIVPGNHDKEYSIKNELISITHREKGIEQKNKEEWLIQQEAYKPFLELVNKIYQIYNKDINIIDTFGVELINVNNINICFMRFDTAWSSSKESLIRTLRIGDYQREILKEEYRKIVNQSNKKKIPISLTIGISHHPFNWLNAEEEDQINEYVMASNFLNVDILMCGHVHDREVLNYYNHKHSLLTLVTGIGGRKDYKPKEKEEHRYSIYLLNPNYNSCEIIMRKTKDDSSFDYDHSFYTAEHEINENKLCYPIRTKENHAFISLSSPDLNRAKNIFIDNNILKNIISVTTSINNFCENVTKLYERYKKEFFGMFPDDMEKIRDIMDEGVKPTKEEKSNWFNSEIALENFAAFLREVCEYFVSSLEKCYTTNTKIRAHFRFYNEEDDSYTKLCYFANKDYDNTQPMQDIKWGSLIEQAFICQLPLVFSVNNDYNKVATEWDDFITIVPRFNSYSKDIRKPTENVTRPLLSFGLSIKYSEKINCDSSILYILDFLRIDNTITNIVDNYIKIFNINIQEFLRHIVERWLVKNK